MVQDRAWPCLQCVGELTIGHSPVKAQPENPQPERVSERAGLGQRGLSGWLRRIVLPAKGSRGRAIALPLTGRHGAPGYQLTSSD